jgi:hypothetical protein
MSRPAKAGDYTDLVASLSPDPGTAFAAVPPKEAHMASTLMGGGGKDRETQKGHGTSALGPSDTSDSASDITGGPGIIEGDVIGLDHGTNEDLDTRAATAGADIGDADLDSDSDSVGTGEHMTAGREPRGRVNGDLLPDHIERVPDAGDDDGESTG